MIEFKLPAIGEGVVEVEIVRWLKQPGQSVHLNEGLVEVMTDKATVEIPSPHAGTLQTIHAHEGVTAAVGTTICTLDDHPEPVMVPPPIARPSAATERVATTDRVLATPAARALARETGIDLATVEGHDGRITKGDVVNAQTRQTVHPEVPGGSSPSSAPARHPSSRHGAAVSAGPPVPQPPAPALAGAPATRRPAPASSGPPATAASPRHGGSAPQADRIPFRGVRRRTADSIDRAFRSAVHCTYVDEVDVTRLVEVRNQARKAIASEGITLNYLPFVIKAVLRGLKRFPILNAQLDPEREEVILHRHYDIGVATATEHGLMVPVLRNADRLSLLDVATELERLVARARSGQASREDLTGSTFTITSLGALGGLHATPILNYPEVGILGVHAIRKVPVVVDDDRIAVGHVMNLSMSFDHRVVDGFESASFLQEVKRYLEDPTLLLLAGI